MVDDDETAPHLEVKDKKTESIEELGGKELLLTSDDEPAILELQVDGSAGPLGWTLGNPAHYGRSAAIWEGKKV